MLIDTHCHLASACYRGSLAAVEARARSGGVGHCVSLGTHPEDDWAEQLAMEGLSPRFVTPCLAIHPTEVHRTSPGDVGKLAALASARPLGAIGEAGLDYYWPAPEGWSEEEYHRRQRELLEAHFRIARACGLNISLHTRDRRGSACFRDAVDIARRFPEVRPVFHCFIGTREQAEVVFRELDGLISFTGIVTFKSSAKLREVAAWCPPDRFMIETDSPYLTPEPHRGKTNEPAYARHIAACLAVLRKVDETEIERLTSKTARNFFRLAC
ncbi:MAG: TatD family hydrolase [Akkermansiaceae bacterium]|nr:TatD family hydrolase [Akkermansiaceae bacterium]